MYNNIAPMDWGILNVNLSHYAELRQTYRLNLDEYAFCSLIYSFSGRTGWCEPMVMNPFKYITGVLNYIGGKQLGFSDKTTEAMKKRLIKEGFLQLSDCKHKIKVTDTFLPKWKQTTGNEDVKDEPQPEPKVNPLKPNRLKKVVGEFDLKFKDVAFFKDVQAFTLELQTLLNKTVLAKLLPTDITEFYDGYKAYYSNKNAVTVEVWRERVKSYIEKSPKLDRKAPNTEGVVSSKEKLLEDVKKYAAKVFYPKKEQAANYQSDVLMFIQLTEKAEKINGLIEQKTIDFKNQMLLLQPNSTKSGGLKNYLITRLAATNQIEVITEGTTNSDVTMTANTEGGKSEFENEIEKRANTEGVTAKQRLRQKLDTR